MFFFDSQSVIVGEDDAKTANGGGAVIGGEWRIFFIIAGGLCCRWWLQNYLFHTLGRNLGVQKNIIHTRRRCAKHWQIHVDITNNITVRNETHLMNVKRRRYLKLLLGDEPK